MSDELKPCPFCGSGRVAGFTSTCDSRLIFREYVACEDCGASTTTHETKAGAAAAWNARAERTCGEYRGDVYETPDGTIDDIELWCEHCDIPLEDGWRHCPNCGAKVVS